MENKKRLSIHWPITIVTLAILFIMVACLALIPDATINGITGVYNIVMSRLTPFMLLFDISLTGICLWMACSKYGRIKLGEGKPEYSTFSYIAMMACAALASASMFWSFTEWAYYMVHPGLNYEAFSVKAMELSVGYAFFHWGFLAQCIYVAIGLVTAYAIYIKKIKSTRMSTIALEMLGDIPGKKIIGIIIDLIVCFTTLAGLGVSLGLGIPVIAGGISRVTGLAVTFPMQVGIVIVLAVIFSWSSFVGTGRGMKFLSDNTVKLLGVFLVYILIFGPANFIQRIFVTAMGTMIQNYSSMAFFADPIQQSGFTEAWTVFFIAFPLSYAGLMGVFVAKISKGRSIRNLIVCCMFGISIGTWLFFSVNSGLAIECEMLGKFSIVNEVVNGDPYAGVFHILDTLPLGVVLAVVYTVCVAGFICTTLDSASLALASTTTKSLDEDNNPPAALRIFWCVMLTLVPLAMMFSNSDFETMKKMTVLVSMPMAVIILGLLWGMSRWISKDLREPGKLLLIKNKTDIIYQNGRVEEDLDI